MKNGINNSKYRVALIGCGRMGSTIDDEVRDYPAVQLPYSHAAGYASLPQCHIVAAADINPETLSNFGERWDVKALYADYKEMLRNEQIDILSITTRATERAEIIKAAIKSGVKAILAEKALATTLEDADTIVDLVESTETVLAVNCSRRWHTSYMKAEELIQKGAIGDLRQVTASCPGGMSHSGSHAIDVLRMFAGGHVEWVMGHTDNTEAKEDEDLRGSGYMLFDNGVTGFFTALRSQVEFDAIGTKGRIRTTANGINWEYELFSDMRGMPVRHIFPATARYRSSTQGVILDIINCIEHGGTPRCGVRDGREALEIAVAIRESERQGGKRISLPLEDRTLKMNSR